MYLRELLDSKVEYEVKSNTSGRFWIQSEINGRLISVFFYCDPGDAWELSFGEKAKRDENNVSKDKKNVPIFFRFFFNLFFMYGFLLFLLSKTMDLKQNLIIV